MKKYNWPTRVGELPSVSSQGTGDIVAPKPEPDWAEERLIHALATGQLGTTKKVLRLAEDLGWTERFLTERLSRSDIREKVISRIRLKALHAVAAAIDSQAEMAKTDLQTYKIMLQTAEVLQTQGAHLNVAIDARKIGDTNSDRKFFEGYHRRIEAQIDTKTTDLAPEPNETQTHP